MLPYVTLKNIKTLIINSLQLKMLPKKLGLLKQITELCDSVNPLIIKRMKTKLKAWFTTILLSLVAFGVSAIASEHNQCSGDEIPIAIVEQLSNDVNGGPRSSNVLIEAYWDTDMRTVNAYLRNAGQNVTVSIVDVATGETTQCVIPGDGPSYIPVTGSSGIHTIFFTLETGEVYYGSFLI